MPLHSLSGTPPLDPFVVVDASLLIAATRPAEAKHGIARAFLKHAAAEFLANRSQLFAADLAIQECAFIICRDALRLDVIRRNYPMVEQQHQAAQQGKRNPRAFDWVALHKLQPGSIARHVPEVGRFITDVRAIPVQVVEPHMIGNLGFSLVDRMRDYMSKYELLPADAHHLAIASAIGAKMVATLDRDWLRAEPDFTVLCD